MKLYKKVLINILWMFLSVLTAIIGVMVVKPANNTIGIIMLVVGIISFIAWLCYLLITNPEILKQEQERIEKKKKLSRQNKITERKENFQYIDGKEDADLTIDEITDIEELLDD